MFSDRKDERKDRETFLATCDTVSRTSHHLAQYLDLHKDFETSTRLLLWIDKLHLFQLFLVDQLHAYLRAAQPRELSTEDRAKIEATHAAIDTASKTLMNGVTEVSRDVALNLKNTSTFRNDLVEQIHELNQKVEYHEEHLSSKLIKHDRALDELNDQIPQLMDAIRLLNQRCADLESAAKTTVTTLNLMDKVQTDDRSRVSKVHDNLELLNQNATRDAKIVTGSITVLDERLNTESRNVREKLEQIERQVHELAIGANQGRISETDTQNQLNEVKRQVHELAIGANQGRISETDTQNQLNEVKREIRDLREVQEQRSRSRSPPRRIQRVSSRSRSPPRRIHRASRLTRPLNRRWDQCNVEPSTEMGTFSTPPVIEPRLSRFKSRPNLRLDSRDDSSESDELTGRSCPWSRSIKGSEFKLMVPDDLPDLVPIHSTRHATTGETSSLDCGIKFPAVPIEPPSVIPVPPPLPPPPPPPRSRNRDILRKPLLGGSDNIISATPEASTMAISGVRESKGPENSFFYSTPSTLESLQLPTLQSSSLKRSQELSDVTTSTIATTDTTSSSQLGIQAPDSTLLWDGSTKDVAAFDVKDNQDEVANRPFQYAEVIKLEPSKTLLVEP